ncbi:MAG: phosphoribosylamine--glycine ligase [Alphaproteobacteria bacterium]
MKILVVGAGGREHALIRALEHSPDNHEIIAAPGNAGIDAEIECRNLTTLPGVISYCQGNKVDLVVIGPEQPLVDGWADALRGAGIAVFGPGARAAEIEASKDFTKQLCDRYHIPTAKYRTFRIMKEALEYLKEVGAPIVVKADGLAAGKGVTVALTYDEAEAAIKACFSGAFGAAGNAVVLEEMLEGEEASVFALADGKTAILFGSAQDHKRAFDGDSGPNTGGMGAYSPAPVMTDAISTQVMKEIITPAIEGLAAEGIPYIGVIFAGIMITKDGPKLIEFNCRFGDPETQVLFARFNGDAARLFHSCATGALDASALSFSPDAAIGVVMASKGYPGAYVKNTPIGGLDKAAAMEGVTILHAGTAKKGEQWLSNGGRVLTIVATAATLADARDRAYEAIAAIDWTEGFYRKDIGWRALLR